MEGLAAVAVVCAALLVGLRWWLAFQAREADRVRLHSVEERRAAAQADAAAVGDLSKRVAQLEAWRDTQALRSIRGG